jgi:hypothetical protein
MLGWYWIDRYYAWAIRRLVYAAALREKRRGVHEWRDLDPRRSTIKVTLDPPGRQ